MTLSQFLRDYLYIPLGGNKYGQIRRYVNLLVTMLLGGLWHGAGWTFIIWGLLHGSYLTLNHGWRYFRQLFQFKLPSYVSRPISVLITFLCVMFAWVFFRSPETKTALTMIRSMLGIHHHLPITQSILLKDKILLGILLLITWFSPNSLQIMNHHQIALTKAVIVTDSPSRWYHWRISPLHIILTGFVLAITLLYLLAKGDGTEFLYFEF
jgi:hypothetical protein